MCNHSIPLKCVFPWPIFNIFKTFTGALTIYLQNQHVSKLIILKSMKEMHKIWQVLYMFCWSFVQQKGGWCFFLPLTSAKCEPPSYFIVCNTHSLDVLFMALFIVPSYKTCMDYFAVENLLDDWSVLMNNPWNNFFFFFTSFMFIKNIPCDMSL